MKRVLSYLKYTKKEAILGPLFKMLEVVFELLVPLIVSNIIDFGIKESNVKYIVLNCLLLLFLAIAGFISATVAQYFSAKAAVRLSTNLRNDLFKKIQELKYSDLDKLTTSTLITRMTNDVNLIQNGVNLTLRLALRSPIVVIGAAIVAFFIDRQTGIIFLITVPILFLIIIAILLISIPLYAKVQGRMDTIIRSSRENLTGVRVLRAFNQSETEIKDFEEKNKKLTSSQLFVGRIASSTNPLTFALINIFIVVLVYVGAKEVDAGFILQGKVVALYNLAGQILVEMIKLANLIMTISKALSSIKRVDAILSLESKLITTNEEDKESEYILEFNDVCMNYPTSNLNSLNNISFKVKRGEVIGIIGGTGSGKTTLINLINHFYDINHGEILFEGKNITSYDDKYIHDKVALVMQKSKLFKGTIKDNITWGNKDASDEEIIKAITLAQGKDILNKKEKGIYELVEADGKNFSGGQKQRLCIARALIKDSDILILDDSSSALDYQTDALLQKAVASIENKTVFVVSQRASSLMHADQIIVLDKGNMVGLGKHEELLKRCLVYKEIYDTQFKKESE